MHNGYNEVPSFLKTINKMNEKKFVWLAPRVTAFFMGNKF